MPGDPTHACQVCARPFANRRNAVDHRCTNDTPRIACTYDNRSCSFVHFHDRQMRRHWEAEHGQKRATKSQCWYSLETEKDRKARKARVKRLTELNGSTIENDTQVDDVRETRGGDNVTHGFSQNISSFGNGEGSRSIASTLQETSDDEFDDGESDGIVDDESDYGEPHDRERNRDTGNYWTHTFIDAVETLDASNSNGSPAFALGVHSCVHTSHSAPSSMAIYAQGGLNTQYLNAHSAFGLPKTSVSSGYVTPNVQHPQYRPPTNDGSIHLQHYTGNQVEMRGSASGPSASNDSFGTYFIHLLSETSSSRTLSSSGGYHGVDLQQGGNPYPDITTREQLDTTQAPFSLMNETVQHHPASFGSQDELRDDATWMRIACAELQDIFALSPAHFPTDGGFTQN